MVPSVLQVACQALIPLKTISLPSGNFQGFSLDSGYSGNSSSVVRYGSSRHSGCFQPQ